MGDPLFGTPNCFVMSIRQRTGISMLSCILLFRNNAKHIHTTQEIPFSVLGTRSAGKMIENVTLASHGILAASPDDCWIPANGPTFELMQSPNPNLAKSLND